MQLFGIILAGIAVLGLADSLWAGPLLFVSGHFAAGVDGFAILRYGVLLAYGAMLCAAARLAPFQPGASG